MKSFWTGAGFSLSLAIVASAAFFLGKGCHNTPQTQITAPDLGLVDLQVQIDSLRTLLEKKGQPQEVLVKVVFHGDTIWGVGTGEAGENILGPFLHYRDSLVDILVYPENDTPSFEYTLFPHDYTILMGETQGGLVWAQAWDLTLGQELAVDSLKVSRQARDWRRLILTGIEYDPARGTVYPAVGLGVSWRSWGVYGQVGTRLSAGIYKEF